MVIARASLRVARLTCAIHAAAADFNHERWALTIQARAGGLRVMARPPDADVCCAPSPPRDAPLCLQASRFARVCLEESFKYALKRKTFGKVLMEHPVIRWKIAEMARQVECTHAQLENVTYQMCTMGKKDAMEKARAHAPCLCAAGCDARTPLTARLCALSRRTAGRPHCAAEGAVDKGVRVLCARGGADLRRRVVRARRAGREGGAPVP